MFFLRKPKLDTEPLSLKMSGIRLGERLLQIGLDDPKLAAAMAAKIGLSGTTAIAVAEAADGQRATAAAADAGTLADVHVTPLTTLPFDGDAFDVAVVHAAGGLLQRLHAAGQGVAAATEAHRVLRRGGRIIVIEAGPRSGLGGLLHPYKPDPQWESAGGSIAVLQAAGFRPVRLLSERDGFRYLEGLKS